MLKTGKIKSQKPLASNQQPVFASSGFVFRCYPDSSFATNRTFVFTNAAADTAVGVDPGLLQPDLNLNAASRWWRRFKGKFGGNPQTPFPVADDAPRATVYCRHNRTVVITGGKLIQPGACSPEFYIEGISPFHNQL